MAKIKKIFGFPCYIAAKNSKIGRKIFNKGTLSSTIKKNFNGVKDLNIGDYVFFCGVNKKIVSINPEYLLPDLILYDFTIGFVGGEFYSLKYGCSKAKLK